MPWHDWQFWIVTGLAAIGLLILLRQLFPRRKSGDDQAACPSCPSGSSPKPRKRRVALTIERRRI
jgi:hypothetical protein